MGGLFQRHPQLQELFGAHAAAVQQDMLNETLIAVVDSLEGLAWLESNLRLLGTKHAEFEVSNEMYDSWTDSILEILSEVSGSDWSPHLEKMRTKLGVSTRAALVALGFRLGYPS